MNTNQKIQSLEQKLNKITERNQRVEGDKAWEISWARKLLIFVLTYFIMNLKKRIDDL